jgi:hypothetical protein
MNGGGRNVREPSEWNVTSAVETPVMFLLTAIWLKCLVAAGECFACSLQHAAANLSVRFGMRKHAAQNAGSWHQ